MWHTPEQSGVASVRHRVPVVLMAVAAVTAFAAFDALSGKELIILGALVAGPGIAAGAGRPRAVLVVGTYALTLVNVLAWWPDEIWGSVQYIVFNAAVVAVTGLGMGIAAQIRAVERAGIRAEKHWRTLAAVVEHSDDAIVATDLHGRLTAFNAGAERLYGLRAEDMVGTAVSAFAALATPPDAPEPSGPEVIARITAGEVSVAFESVRVHRDGTVKDVSVVVSPIRDQRGAVVGVSSVTRDISAQHRAEEKAHQSQRMASLGQLAGGVAHDFNNLLGIMLNFIDFAREAVTAPQVATLIPDASPDLGKARLAGERAVDLTRQLLTFTRQDTIHPTDLDVNASIAEISAMLTRTIGENIKLITGTPAPAGPALIIRADAGQIQQVLLNLAVNARDAMPDGGTLIIEASLADLEDQQPSLNPAPAGGCYVRLLVSDNGVGMSADVASRVFEPFYTTKPKGHGTGLGLATVYGIVAEAGGSINVYSEPGMGTTFRVYFPLVATAVDQDAVPAAGPAAAPPDGHGFCVLVVEDERVLGEAVARILRAGGYRTLSADSGPDALKLDAESGCDLLLTDLIMPEMSGRHLAEKMLARHPGLPVLYMSGYSDGLLGSELILDEQTAFIEKPFTSARLLNQIGGLAAAASTTTSERSAGASPR
ncbi:MAG TPA: ATP-binding protein [Actinoplanes sp.]|nr:ATP-binding protein [Actinoplanes sp.]